MYKLTWVGWLNFIVCQWFLFRLAYRVDPETNRKYDFSMELPILPLTGWVTRYIVIGGRRQINIPFKMIFRRR